jgi:hypothetical protein
MKSHPIAQATAFAACLLAQPVLAYQLSPARTESILSGKMQFVNGGPPFTCKVRFVLRTHGGHAGQQADIEIARASGASGLCKNAEFTGLPWRIEVQSASGGSIVGLSWIVGGNSCGDAATGFEANSDGIWTFGPGCLSGSLPSSPSVVIVP